MKGSTWIKLGAFLVAVIGICLALHALGIDLTRLTPERIRAFVLSFGPWAPAIYILVFGQPLIPLPAIIMTLAAGLAFGPVWGTLASLTGATIRACSEFGIARLIGRDVVASFLRGKAAELDNRLAAQGFKAVLLIRIIPNFPFDMQNYLLGFSKVRFGPYALGSLLGLIPGCFSYVYLGYSLTDPKNLWKFGVAVGIIAGLMLWQRAWQKRRASATVTSTVMPGPTQPEASSA